MPSTAIKTPPKPATRKRRNCVHYWVLDAPEGPFSRARCKICGRKREFPNSIEAEGEMTPDIGHGVRSGTRWSR